MIVNCVTHLKRISGIAPLVLVISSSVSVVHGIIAALGECPSVILVCGKIIGVRVDAVVGILPLVELVVLRLVVPCLRQWLTLMSVELNTPGLIRVLVRSVLGVVTFILRQVISYQ